MDDLGGTTSVVPHEAHVAGASRRLALLAVGASRLVMMKMLSSNKGDQEGSLDDWRGNQKSRQGSGEMSFFKGEGFFLASLLDRE